LNWPHHIIVVNNCYPPFSFFIYYFFLQSIYPFWMDILPEVIFMLTFIVRVQ